MARLYLHAKYTLLEKNNSYFSPQYEEISLDEIPWVHAHGAKISTNELKMDEFWYRHYGGSISVGTFDDAAGKYYFTGECGLKTNSESTMSDTTAHSYPHVSLTVIIDGKEYDYDKYLLVIPVTEGFHTVSVTAKVMTSKKMVTIRESVNIRMTDENNFVEINVINHMYPEKKYFTRDKAGRPVEFTAKELSYKNDCWFWSGSDIKNIKNPEVTILRTELEGFVKDNFCPGRIPTNATLPESAGEPPREFKPKYSFDKTPMELLSDIEDLCKLARFLAKPVQAAVFLHSTPHMVRSEDYVFSVTERMRGYLGSTHKFFTAFDPLWEKYADHKLYTQLTKYIGLRDPDTSPFNADDAENYHKVAEYIEAQMKALDKKLLLWSGNAAIIKNMANASVRLFEFIKAGMMGDDLIEEYRRFAPALHAFEKLLLDEWCAVTQSEGSGKRAALAWDGECKEKERKSAAKLIKKLNRGFEKKDNSKKKKKGSRKDVPFIKKPKKAKKERKKRKKLSLPKIRLPKLTLPKFRLPKFRLPKFRLPKLRMPDFNLHMLVMLGAALICGLFFVLEATGIIYKLAWDVKIYYFYEYYVLDAICKWFAATKVTSFFMLLLWLLQLVLIVAAALIETVVWIAVMLLSIVYVLVSIVVQIGIFYILPFAAFVFGVVLLIIDIKDDEMTAAEKALSIILLIAALVFGFLYYYAVTMYNISFNS